MDDDDKNIDVIDDIIITMSKMRLIALTIIIPIIIITFIIIGIVENVASVTYGTSLLLMYCINT